MGLDRACLDLIEGEILGLVGDNGAGKSTLLKVLSGGVRRDAGAIFINGEKMGNFSPQLSRDKGLEMVYQDLSLCGNMTVWENIFLGRYLRRSVCDFFLPVLNKGQMEEQATRVLESVGIQLKSVTQPLKNLSGGEQQAVAISRCMLFNPRIVLLDEPTASMAVWEREKILDMILKMKAQGRSIIMVTHDLQEIFRIADRILVLKEGRTLWSGPTVELEPGDVAHMMFVGLAVG